MNPLRTFLHQVRNADIRTKLAGLTTLMIGAIAVFVFLIVPSRQEEQALRAVTDKARSIAQMTAFSISSALVFSDTVSATEELESAQQNKDLLYIAVIDKTGKIFVVFNKEKAEAANFLESRNRDVISAEGMIYETSAVVLHNGTEIGRLYLGLSLDDVRREINTSRLGIAVVSLIIFIVGMAAVFGISTVVTRPLRHMVKTVEDIAKGELSKRATVTSEDEVGNLARSFNTMVDKLALTHHTLEETNRDLERRVLERTYSLQQEVADRRRSEEALRMSEERYRTLFEESKDAIFTSSVEGKILDINPAGVKLFGYASKEEMKEIDSPNVLYGDPDARNKFTEVMQQQGYVQDYELELKTKDGRRLTVLETATAVRDEGGKVLAHRGIIRDITTQRRLERQFLRAQRMESIGTLAGGIAHDLNNVLAPIMMAVEVLLAKYGDDEGKRILETLATSAKRGSDIVKQILTFGRGVEGGRILVQPKHIVREIEKIVNETFPKSIQVKVVLQKNLWTILADPTQLHQVLLNLCVNARDGMPMGGILMVSAENVSLDEYFASMNTEAKAGPYVVVTIADSGTGIPPEIIDQIFDPFFTTKKIGEGTGLGLSTALGIVKGHGGFINVYSELGKGTSFKVYLPAQEKEQEALPGEERLEPPLGQGEMILVVDDEASIREIAKITLEANGYNVLTANDGVEAVSIYAQDNGRIKVVLMDMMMPGMDGFATIRALQIMKATARIVATSGGTARDGFDMALMPGVDAFLKKPYTAGKLLTALHEVLNKR